MFKKILVSVSVLMLLVVTLGFSALAMSVEDKAAKIAEDANQQIATIVQIAQFTPVDDAAIAKYITDIIGQTAIDRLEKMGVEAECIYTMYIIDGHEVMIDPIIIIKF